MYKIIEITFFVRPCYTGVYTKNKPTILTSVIAGEMLGNLPVNLRAFL